MQSCSAAYRTIASDLLLGSHYLLPNLLAESDEGDGPVGPPPSDGAFGNLLWPQVRSPAP